MYLSKYTTALTTLLAYLKIWKATSANYRGSSYMYNPLLKYVISQAPFKGKKKQGNMRLKGLPKAFKIQAVVPGHDV